MSSRFRPFDSHTFGPSSSHGFSVLQSDSAPSHIETAGRTGLHDASPRLGLNTLTLDELSEELDRRTRETQRLQDEVETVTKQTLERFGCMYGIRSPGPSGYSTECNVCDSPGDSTAPAAHQQVVTQSSVCDVGILNHRDVHSSGEQVVVGNAVDECLQQLCELQLDRESQDQPEQEAFSSDTAIMNLQTELHKVQVEKDALSELRLKDSRKHVGQMEKMLCVLEELQKIKRAGDQKLQETEDDTLALNRRVETLERHVKEMYSSLLSQGKQCGDETIAHTNVSASSRLRRADVKISEELNLGRDNHQEEYFSSVERPGSQENTGVNEPNERIEDLIASLGQEVALLTGKLSSSKNNSVSLGVKLELLRKLTERQTSLHQDEVGDLVAQLSSRKDKVCCLEQQLADAQREKEQCLQQAEELQFQFGQLERCGRQQQCELQEQVKVLRGQLEVAWEQLRRGGEEKTSLQALLEQRVREGRESQELLEEKSKELELRQQEAQQHLARLEEVQSRCQTLCAAGEKLRAKLDESEKLAEALRLQVESSVQAGVQHNHIVNNLHQENTLLSNQLNQHKLEIQQLRAESDQHGSQLAALMLEKLQLQASVAEQNQRVEKEALEKEQLSSQLEIQRLRLVTLTEEHKQLRRLHSCKVEEHEGAVLKLHSRLRNAHDELNQVRSTLRTLEGADGHGLRAAMDMQEKITARREQIDSLQSKVQHLEETVEKLHQEKHYQSLEHQRQLQELTFIREEKRHLGDELQALRSKDKQLRDRISQLEAILHKMCEGFADCQDFIQLQEQQFFRLKLQHALDLKELQGQNLHTALNAPPPDLAAMPRSAPSAPPCSQHASNARTTPKSRQRSPARELRSLVKELRGVISESEGPHTTINDAAGSSFRRRRSAPERVHGTTLTDKSEEVESGSALRRRTCGSEPHSLKTAELNGNAINNKSSSQRPVILTAAKLASPRQLLSLGRKSPVHSLLTSDPNTQQ